MRVGIVGCGFAGGAAALFLSRAGHDVTVYEAVEEPGAVGAGIVIQPTGMQVLAELGLLGPILERGARIDRLLCLKGGARRPLVDLQYAVLGEGLFGLGLHRGVLFSVLYDAVKASPAEVVTGVFVVDRRRDGDETWLVDDQGQEHGPHDLIVVADGARCELRHHANARVTEYPWGALWFVAEDPDRVYERTLFQVVRSTTQLLGFLPTGIGPDGTNVVSLFWSVRNDQVDAWKSDFSKWRDHVLAEDERCAFLLDQIDGPDAMLFSRYHDVVMRPWFVDRMVFIGDAAHATSPQLGQGTNLALMDAAALGAVLDDDVDASLRRYEAARRTHVAFYQFATRWLTPVFQSNWTWLGPLRDVFMPIMGRIGYFDAEMVRSMTGIKMGIVRKSLPPPVQRLPSDRHNLPPTLLDP